MSTKPETILETWYNNPETTMKIFFAAAYQSDKTGFDRNKKIFEEIEKLGYTHLFDETVRITYEEFVEKMQGKKEEFAKHTKSIMKNIQGADICVFEVSSHSLGIGFGIEKSLELNKPTIVLHHVDINPIFLSGVEDEKFIIKAYDDKNYKKMLKEALELARERRDKRFNFFISPKLLEYLEKTSNTEGITKSKFIRNLIVNKMRDKNTNEENI